MPSNRTPVSEQQLWPAFAAAVRRRGHATALHFDTTTVSFADLETLALRAAAFLSGAGIVAGDVVAIQLPKRAGTYAIMLGCLRIGAIYAPLDPRNPTARTGRMLARIKPRLLFTTARQPNPYGAVVVTAASGDLDIDAWPAPLAGHDDAPQLSPLHPAYIMFTSGSTGEPKGAVIPQQGIALSLIHI